MGKSGEDPGMIREVTASGSHREVGRALGRQCKDQALRMEKRWRRHIERIPDVTVDKVVALARQTLPLSEAFYPQYVEELNGYAEGVGMKPDLVYAMICDLPVPGRGCTDIAVNSNWTKDDCVYAAHNEDVEPYNYKDVAIVRVKPDDEPGFIGVSYCGIMPTVGMNAAGISLTGNALCPNDLRPGIPKMFPVRKVLREKGIYQALKASMPEGRGHSFNNIVSDENGEIYSMEGSATTFDALYAEDGWLVHTNHYLSPRMWRFEDDMHTRFSSIVRYHRAKKLFKHELGQVDISTFKKVFSDHVGHPESICRHPDPDLGEVDQTATIFSVVFDLTSKVAWICHGSPCTGTYRKYTL
jgi:isopenicillin-N N-acyltransferase-like protein